MVRCLFGLALAPLLIGAVVPTSAPPLARPIVDTTPRPCRQGCLSATEAVAYATYLAPRARVAAEFEITVKAVGSEKGKYFLNSELDYRDRNCLTIVLLPSAAAGFVRDGKGKSIEDMFKGKRIAVRGLAGRVRIDFLTDGKPTGKYYYQVHVPVASKGQLAFT